MSKQDKQEDWDQIIYPKGGLLNFKIGEIWQYKDLVSLFVYRNFVATHKQTILGPLWHIIQPILTTLAFTFIFGEIAKVPTDEVNPFLFYLTSITIWSFFSRCLTSTSNTFTSNAGIFGKVYFPRLVVPISNVISALISFFIQFGLLLIVCVYFYFFKNYPFHLSYHILYIPVILLLMIILGLGLGILISALTTKYRDLVFFINFGVQLIMYVSPVIYSLKSVPEKYKAIALLNPLSPLIEGFRYSILGTGLFNEHMLLYSISITFVVFIIGLALFNKVEKTFMDTV
ncbi:MAG TPA: ABC transporter permease [Cytophagaceae bacterium]|jgi:lipopolysaccharide transport system permease protein|nr:ABC transporter permease [Cytophagaceae bacterium]